jgi:hypothetical protein
LGSFGRAAAARCHVTPKIRKCFVLYMILWLS